MAEVLIVAGCATMAWAILGFAIPWMTRLAVLYRLHDLRDDLYDAAERFPPARQTRTYRSIEFLVTMALHIVRERSYEESVEYAAVLLNVDKAASHDDREGSQAFIKATEREASEVFLGEHGKAALATLRAVPSSAGWLMAMRVIFGKPSVMLALITLIAGALIKRALGGRRQGDGNSHSAPPMAGSMPQFFNQTNRRGTLDTIRILSTVTPRRIDVSRALGLKQGLAA